MYTASCRCRVPESVRLRDVGTSNSQQGPEPMGLQGPSDPQAPPVAKAERGQRALKPLSVSTM